MTAIVSENRLRPFNPPGMARLASGKVLFASGFLAVCLAVVWPSLAAIALALGFVSAGGVVSMGGSGPSAWRFALVLLVSGVVAAAYLSGPHLAVVSMGLLVLPALGLASQRGGLAAEAIVIAMAGLAGLATLAVFGLSPTTGPGGPIALLLSALGAGTALVLAVIGLAELKSTSGERAAFADVYLLDLDLRVLSTPMALQGGERRLSPGDKLDLDLSPRDWPEGEPVEAALLRDGAAGVMRMYRRADRVCAQWRPIAAVSVPRPTEVQSPQAGDAPRSELAVFYAGLSHDLKTPLNAILGFSDLIRSALFGPLSADYVDRAELIHQSADDLLLMVESMMELARADAADYAFTPEETDLAALGRGSAHMMEGVAARKDVRLVSEGDQNAITRADPRGLRLVWQNLLSNALKYSDAGDEVRYGAEIVAGTAHLWVSDTGAGMSSDDLARIGRPFQQGDNSRGRDGTGLGLTIVRRMAAVHGGRVRISTAPGEGTRVRVSFPARESESLPRSLAAE